ncbi:MAG: hypothetical protein HY689_01205 [Chloroflexi bacterium]|nr:hypothetical protein [Chloroflexota bacterium]
MYLRDYWAVLRTFWWLVLLAGLVGGTGAYVSSKLEPPLYRSSTRLYVMPVKPDFGNVMFIQNVVRQYSQLVIADRFLADVGEQLRLDLPVAALRQKITASGTAENLVIQVDVDDQDPGRAQAIARQLAKAFIQDQEARMKDVSKDNRIEVRSYDDPTPPALLRPSARRNVVAGGLLGLLIGTVCAFVLVYLDDTIKSSEDAERSVALPVLGSIPAAPGS